MAVINSQTISDFVSEALADTDCFPVSVEIRKNNDIVVEIDSDSRVDIDFVAQLNRKIEENFAPEIDDYNLEVGSAGLTSPLVLPRQFKKHIGHDMEVLTADGRKLHGLLTAADDNGFTLRVEEKVKKEGEKRPVLESRDIPFAYTDAKKVTYDLKF